MTIGSLSLLLATFRVFFPLLQALIVAIQFLNAVCSLLEPIKKENCLEPEEEKTISVILRMQIDDSYKLLPQIIGIRPATLATDQLTMAIGIYL